MAHLREVARKMALNRIASEIHWRDGDKKMQRTVTVCSPRLGRGASRPSPLFGTPKSRRSSCDVPSLRAELLTDLKRLKMQHPRSGDGDALFWPGVRPVRAAWTTTASGTSPRSDATTSSPP